MRPAARIACLSAFALCALAPLVAHAQTTIVKPEFLLIVDTSGSMTASTGTGTNSCGYTRTRINDAACVVRNIADGVGDAIFGMETFALSCSASGCHYTYGTNLSCGVNNCAETVTGYPFQFQGCDDSSQLQVRIAENQSWELRTWGDGSWTSCANPSGLTAPTLGGNELSNFYNATCSGAAVSNTPLAGALHVAWQYLANRFAPARPSPYINFNNTGAVDPYPACRPLNIILLTDGDETCTGSTATPAANNARNIGCLRLDLNGNGVIENPIPATDPNPALRGKFESNVDLNADGDCYDAGEQRAFRINTYAIGFGTPCGTGTIEAIATGGGVPLHTVSCTATQQRGYYASNETDISDAINDIISRSALREVCNGVDDNCNGVVDEGYAVGAACSVGVGACRRTGTNVCNAVGDDVRCNATPGAPGPENTLALCSDGIDNDCDGFVDCGDPDCATQPTCTGTCTPTTEICDGRDNDCDGLVDEGGITRPCGVAIGVCTTGTQTCQPQTAPGSGTGIWGACTGTGPSTEICDGLDNNCNGVADEGLTRACGTMVGACRAGVQQCVMGSFSGPCIGSVGPTTEVCDGIDNDCNGMIDDAIPPGGSCGAAGVGVCTAGTIQCVMGRLQCVGGRMPGPETCNGLDDDCNGAVDDGIASMACTPPGVTFPTDPPMGACRRGTTRCVMGATVCEGAVGPSPEVCNGVDDNCNGMIDEGVPMGTACGIMVGVCRVGTTACVMGRDVCMGSVMPMAEVCNGMDDNCNGMVDEGNPGGGSACGSAVGACRPGVNVCRGGMVVCDGAVGPTPETCNGVDDDCNGMIDDGLPSGMPCGSSVGECRPGTSRCVGGRMVCEGARGPTPEECDCRDNDCDGMVDNMPAGGSPLCGGDSVCAGAPSCACLRPCNDSEFPCPVGRTCMDVDGRRLCVGDPCATITCSDPTTMCVNGECRSRCAGVTCEAPLVCNPRDGRCVTNSCRVLENCPTGQVCRMDMCINDPCAGVTCPAGQACYGVMGDGGMLTGQCAPSCAGVMCPAGQACVRGACQTGVPCAGVTCPSGQVCNPTSGMCGADLCVNRRCTRDQACDPATGSCVDDPCAIVHCPSGQTCSAGECHAPPAPPSSPRDRVIGSGGGGFGGCAVGPAPAGRTNAPGAAGLSLAGLALATTLARRRRRRRGGGTDARSGQRDGGEVR